MTNQAPRTRHRLKWSLRTFFLLLTIAAVWFGYISNSARSQRFAVEEVRSLGGKIRYDYHYVDGPLNSVGGPTYISRPNEESTLPAWLIATFGVDFFHPVVHVNLRQTDATDETLKAIGKLDQLRYLYLDDTKVSDDGLAHLNGMRELDWLTLDRTQISDAGIKSLRDLPELSVLQARGSLATSASAEWVPRNLPNCSFHLKTEK